MEYHLVLCFCFLLKFLCQIRSQEIEYDVQAWQQAADYLKSAMNEKIDPCSNFFDHVCGRWNDPNQEQQSASQDESSPNKANTYQRAMLEKLSRTVKVLDQAIQAVDLKKPNLPLYRRQVRSFYDHCSRQTPNSKDLNKQMYQAIETRFGPLPLVGGSTPAKWNVWTMLGMLQRHADIGIGVDSGVLTAELGEQLIAEWKNESAPVSALTILPASPKEEFNSTGTREIILAMASAMDKKVEESKVDDLVTRIEKLYDDISGIQADPNVLASGAFYDLANFTKKYPFMNDYFAGLFNETLLEDWKKSEQPTVRLQNEEWLKAFVAITQNSTHKPDAWQALAFVSVIGGFRDEYFGDYDDSEVKIVLDPKSIKERCLEYVVRYMAPGAARLYFDHINEDIQRWRSEIQLMARNIFAAFRFMLNSIEWMDEGEKIKVNEKIDAVKFYPGVPDWIADDAKVAENMLAFDETKSLYENELLAGTAFYDRQSSQLLTGPQDEDPPPTFELNSQYDPATKTVTTFLGFILPPYYQPTYPLAVKYGGFGTVIGHELGHAFDNTGVYDPASPDRPWLKKSTLKEFEKRKACLVQQYSTYCYKKLGMCVNGEQTIGDNIADIDGIKAAYLAYKFVARTLGGDIPVPQLVKYTSDQIFFISATRQWCAKHDPTALTLILDEHTPDRARMEIAMRNVPQFANAFQCPAGSAAIPLKSCSLWANFNFGSTQKQPKDKTSKKENEIDDDGDEKRK